MIYSDEILFFIMAYYLKCNYNAVCVCVSSQKVKSCGLKQIRLVLVSRSICGSSSENFSSNLTVTDAASAGWIKRKVRTWQLSCTIMTIMDAYGLLGPHFPWYFTPWYSKVFPRIPCCILKNNGSWYLWFHEEPLTSMEPFCSTKCSL